MIRNNICYTNKIGRGGNSVILMVKIDGQKFAIK